MSLEWAAAAAIIVAATFVFGLAGFGIGLVALSLLPFFMTLATAVPLVTIYAALASRKTLRGPWTGTRSGADRSRSSKPGTR